MSGQGRNPLRRGHFSSRWAARSSARADRQPVRRRHGYRALVEGGARRQGRRGRRNRQVRAGRRRDRDVQRQPDRPVRQVPGLRAVREDPISRPGHSRATAPRTGRSATAPFGATPKPAGQLTSAADPGFRPGVRRHFGGAVSGLPGFLVKRGPLGRSTLSGTSSFKRPGRDRGPGSALHVDRRSLANSGVEVCRTGVLEGTGTAGSGSLFRGPSVFDAILRRAGMRGFRRRHDRAGQHSSIGTLTAVRDVRFRPGRRHL